MNLHFVFTKTYDLAVTDFPSDQIEEISSLMDGSVGEQQEAEARLNKIWESFSVENGNLIRVYSEENGKEENLLENY